MTQFPYVNLVYAALTIATVINPRVIGTDARRVVGDQVTATGHTFAVPLDGFAIAYHRPIYGHHRPPAAIASGFFPIHAKTKIIVFPRQ